MDWVSWRLPEGMVLEEAVHNHLDAQVDSGVARMMGASCIGVEVEAAAADGHVAQVDRGAQADHEVQEDRAVLADHAVMVDHVAPAVHSSVDLDIASAWVAVVAADDRDKCY